MAQEQKEEVRSEPVASAGGTSKTITRRKDREGSGRLERVTPLSAFRHFMDDMDRLFSGFGFGSLNLPMEFLGGGAWSPAVETIERGNRLVFRADLPGLAKEDVKVEIEDDTLVVSGERKQELEETKGGRYYSERRYGSFERRILLPEGVDPESVDASFDNGVLEISLAMPERTRSKSKKIEVKSCAKKEEAEGEKGVEPIH